MVVRTVMGSVVCVSLYLGLVLDVDLSMFFVLFFLDVYEDIPESHCDNLVVGGHHLGWLLVTTRLVLSGFDSCDGRGFRTCWSWILASLLSGHYDLSSLFVTQGP